MNMNNQTIDNVFNNMILDTKKTPVNAQLTSSWLTMLSPYTTTENSINDKIILITQFYIDNNNHRQQEIIETLKFNLNNNGILNSSLSITTMTNRKMCCFF